MKTITCYINDNTKKNPPPWDISQATNIIMDKHQEIVNKEQEMIMKASQAIADAAPNTELELFHNNRCSILITCRNSKNGLYGVGVANFWKGKYKLPFNGDRREGLITVFQKNHAVGSLFDTELEACVLYNSLLHFVNNLKGYYRKVSQPVDIFIRDYSLYHMIKPYIDKINNGNFRMPERQMISISSDSYINLCINSILRVIVKNSFDVRILFLRIDTKYIDEEHVSINQSSMRNYFYDDNNVGMPDIVSKRLYGKFTWSFMNITPKMLSALYKKQYILKLMDESPFDEFLVNFINHEGLYQDLPYEIELPCHSSSVDNYFSSNTTFTDATSYLEDNNPCGIFKWDF